ncbi:MAG TPA: hypothetical protein ENK18_15705 [Deltaproteobacteria bacterium]|nr:hypothetical protein [Deltaproteobacteria bacterium]
MDSDVEGLLYALVVVDRRAAVWCAAQCARTVGHLVPDTEPRPRLAIEAAEAWVRGGPIPPRALAEAAHRAGYAERAAHERARIASRAGQPHEAASATAAAYAARAAKRVASSVRALRPASAAGAAARAAAHAACDPHDPAGDLSATWERAYRAHLRILERLVRAERWPWTPQAPHAEPDQLSDPRTAGIPIPELLAARARARRLGLAWADPRQRAAAERAEEDPLPEHPHPTQLRSPPPALEPTG